jgi:osmotically-inducible protein OsmY
MSKEISLKHDRSTTKTEGGMKMITKRSKYLSRVSTIFLTAGFSVAFCLAAAVRENIEPSKITSAVETELLVDDMVNSSKIDVTTHDGVVTLTGNIDNILAKERAIRIAESVKGVRSVVDEITVIPRMVRKPVDIEEDVKQALLLDPATESYSVQVKANDAGVVTLTGQVQSWAEKALTGEIAKGVKGVTGLNNKVEIVYPEKRSDFDIKKEIDEVMAFDIWVDPLMIDVKVKNGEVTLIGTVGSAAEKRRARIDAWTYGVKKVNDDRLEVKWWARDTMQKESKYSDMSDNDIKNAVRDAFLYDPRVLSFEPVISVQNGVVTLTGIVDNLIARRAAERDASNTVGVWRVKDFLKVRSRQPYSDALIKQHIEHAFVTNPLIEPYQLETIVINGKVYLNGRVEFTFEKEQAERLASRQPGVEAIDNDIIVEDVWKFKTDSEIKEDIENEFYWSLLVHDDIYVDVENGRVTLTGTVDSPYEAEAAVDDAFRGGARSVVNDLDIAWGHPNQGTYEWKYYNPDVYP